MGGMLVEAFRLVGFPPYTPFMRFSLVATWGLCWLCIGLLLAGIKDYAARFAFVLASLAFGAAVLYLKDDVAGRQSGIGKLDAMAAAATDRKQRLAGRMENMLRPMFDTFIASTKPAVTLATDAQDAAQGNIRRMDTMITWGE